MHVAGAPRLAYKSSLESAKRDRQSSSERARSTSERGARASESSFNEKRASDYLRKSTGAPNFSFLLDPLKRYFKLSGVHLKLCRFILGCAIIFLSESF